MGKSLRYNEKYFIFAAKWQLKKLVLGILLSVIDGGILRCLCGRMSLLSIELNYFVYIFGIFLKFVYKQSKIFTIFAVGFLKFSDHE